MVIKFSWDSFWGPSVRNRRVKRAIDLVQKISIATACDLSVAQTDIFKEALVVKRQKLFDVPVENILRELRANGVQAEITINGYSLLQFAGHQDHQAQRRRQIMQEAIDMLKATRSWLKHRSIQQIRLKLEQNLD